MIAEFKKFAGSMIFINGINYTAAAVSKLLSKENRNQSQSQ
jgi:hypothetical protein